MSFPAGERSSATSVPDPVRLSSGRIITKRASSDQSGADPGRVVVVLVVVLVVVVVEVVVVLVVVVVLMVVVVVLVVVVGTGSNQPLAR
jgi:Flp pilus assembly protein TadB